MIATTGRPGPVLVDLPVDVTTTTIEGESTTRLICRATSRACWVIPR